MIVNNKISEYPDLEGYLNHFKDDDEFNLIFEDDGFTISINHVNKNITFTNDKIHKLIDGEQYDYQISYLGSCGFSYENYTEVCISVNHPNYSFIDSLREWRTEPLKFHVGNSLIEIGDASPLFVLLFEPVYRDSDFQYDFDQFATIKIFSANNNLGKLDFIKALYYLNSSYLKKIGFVASVNHLEIDDSDPLDLWNNDIYDIFDRIKTSDIKLKPDLDSIKPLTFYNYAQASKGDEKFLNLYRILEFFMNRSRLKKLKEIRRNSHYSEEDILKFVENMNEEKLLINLISETLKGREQIKNRLLNFAYEHNLIQQKDSNILCLCKELYKYRNSLVHAKETQIENTLVPNLFIKSTDKEYWIDILNEISVEVIKKYNKTSG